jgi:hypothetical protein
MARDSGGTYTRVSNSFSNPVSSTIISPTDAETFFDELETEMTDSLSRSGKGGMSADLDMNNNDINEIKTAVFQGSTSGNTTVQATAIAGTTTLTLPAATDTLVGKATTDTLTNKTFDTAGTGNSLSINGLAATANTGTGSVVRATSPSLTTPAIVGITNGTPPAAGNVGEIISNTVTLPGVALTTATNLVWNSISLTAGIWLVGGTAGVFGGAGCVFTHMHSDHNSDGSTTVGTSPNGGSTTALHITSNHPNGWIFTLGIRPYNLSATTTIRAVSLVDFSGGTAAAYGHLWGLRIA